MTIKNPSLIPPRVDFLDQRTGKISREWFLYLLNLGNLTIDSGNANDLAVQVAFDNDNTSQVSELTKIVERIDVDKVDPFSVTGTVRYVNATSPNGILSVGGVPYQNNGTITHAWAGTSGGVPYFNTSTSMLSSAVLGSTQVVLGGGAGAAPNTSANLTFNGTTLAVTGAATISTTLLVTGAITNSALTATRVPFASTAGLIVDDSGFTFNTTGDILTVGAINVAGSTAPTIGWYTPSANQVRTPNRVRFDGNFALGVNPTDSVAFRIGGATVGTDTTQYGMSIDSTFSTAATASVFGAIIEPALAAGLATGTVFTYQANNVTLGVGASVGTQYGFSTADLTRGTSLIAGFRGNVSSGTGKWNAYMVGTAANAFAGSVRIGSVVAPTVALDVTGAILASTTITATGDLAVNGGDLTSSAATFNMLTATVTTLNIGNAATTMRLAATGGAIGIGTAATNSTQLTLGGNFTSGGASSNAIRLQLTDRITAAVGDTSVIAQAANAGTITTQGATEVISVIASHYFVEPNITLGTGDTVTRAATIYVVSAPTEGVTSNSAIYVASGSTDIQALTATTGTFSGDVAVNGGDLTSSAATFNFVATPTTLAIGAAATTASIGASTGTFTVNNTTLAAKAITASTTLGVTGLATFATDRWARMNNQTSAAAANLGTLTNAPAAGDPGFWLKINIGGTNYAIPCWAG